MEYITRKFYIPNASELKNLNGTDLKISDLKEEFNIEPVNFKLKNSMIDSSLMNVDDISVNSTKEIEFIASKISAKICKNAYNLL